MSEPNHTPPEHRSEELHFLPCPFCGGKARMAAYSKLAHYTVPFLAAECACCGARGPVSVGTDADKARRKWNQQIKAEAARSALYLLGDADPQKLAEVCGLPIGFINAALANIIPQNTTITDGANH